MTNLRRVCMCICSVVMILFAIGLGRVQLEAFADTEDYDFVLERTSDNEFQPYLFTSLSISLNGGDGAVWATVKNDFTLFPSTVMVIVQLYSSLTYKEDYNEMTLMSENSITDLDMGNTLIATSSTGGEQRYWIGRMRYKIDGKNWEEKTIGAFLYSANGDYIGIL